MLLFIRHTFYTNTTSCKKILMFFFYNSFIDPSVNLTKCGPSLLPSNLTFFIRSSCLSPSDLSKCEERLTQQRGYTPQDIEALLQIRKSLDAAGEVGVDICDLCQTHTHLEEQPSGCTRSLQQYMMVLTFTMKISLSLIRHSAQKPTTLIGFWLFTVCTVKPTKMTQPQPQANLSFLKFCVIKMTLFFFFKLNQNLKTDLKFKNKTVFDVCT